MQQKFTFTSICTLLISLLLSLSAVEVKAQKILALEQEDSVPLFRGLAVSVDLFGAVQRQVSDYGQYEASLRVNLRDKYFPVFELGLGDANHEEDLVTGIAVKTRAPYGRIGCDFNVMKNKHDIYRIYVGARYAYTSFDFDLQHKGVQDPVYGGLAPYGVNDKCNTHWLEGVFTVDAHLAGPVRLGWSVRYRRRLFSDLGSTGEVWYIPGFGRSDKTNIGGTFNLTFEI